MVLSRKCVPVATWRLRRLLFGALFALSLLAGKHTSADEELVGLWDFFGRADVAGGYRDNVLRSGLTVEHSAFAQGTVEALLTRFWSSGAHVSSMMLAEGTRYFDAPSVDDEQFLSAVLTGGFGMGESSEGKAAISYAYQNQVLDVSETEGDLRRVLVKGHSLALEPSWKWDLGRHWFAELGGAGMRQGYETELDDYWEGTARAALLHTYGARSEVGLDYQCRWRVYDTRGETDSEGFVVPGTDLVYEQHEFGASWRHYWDAARHWRTTARLSGLFNRDNGAGYFDYDRVQFRSSMRWVDRGWDIGGTARVGHYYYHLQSVGDGRRYRDLVVLGLSVEKRLASHWLVKASAEREWDMSNDPIDDFSDWACWAGVGYEF